MTRAWSSKPFQQIHCTYLFSVVIQPKSGLGRVVIEVSKLHNKHNRRIAILSAGFEPIVAAVKRLKMSGPLASTGWYSCRNEIWDKMGRTRSSNWKKPDSRGNVGVSVRRLTRDNIAVIWGTYIVRLCNGLNCSRNAVTLVWLDLLLCHVRFQCFEIIPQEWMYGDFGAIELRTDFVFRCDQ
jgi:hypothetical protein